MTAEGPVPKTASHDITAKALSHLVHITIEVSPAPAVGSEHADSCNYGLHSLSVSKNLLITSMARTTDSYQSIDTRTMHNTFPATTKDGTLKQKSGGYIWDVLNLLFVVC
jgi:hypothetical protein